MYNVNLNADEDKARVYITDINTYKTAISTKLYEQNIDSKAAYRFYVSPINYQGEEGKKTTTPYTYMADILCGYLRQLLQEKFEVKVGSRENLVTSEGIIEVFSDLNKDKQVLDIHIYSKADAIYRKMVDCVKNHDLVKYYDYMYNLMQMVPYDDKERNYSKFYLNTWVKKLDENIKNELSKDTEYRRIFLTMTDDYIVATEGYMGKRERDYEKGTFIAEKLRQCYEDMDASTIKSQYILDRRGWALFCLYDIIMRGNNHRGAVEIVAQCIEKCNQYKAYVNIEEYAAHILRRVVFYYNMCDFQSALKISQQLEKIAFQLEGIYRGIHNGFEELHLEKLSVAPTKASLIGKIYSNLGQAYAFRGDFSDSSAAFADALERFAEDGGDYNITMSYYLHLLIEHGKKDDYELNAKNYFNADTLEGQLESVKVSDNPFALFVFVKAFKSFYVNDVANQAVLDGLMLYVDGKTKLEKNYHPWELIYKQLCECAWMMAKCYDKKDSKLSDKYAKVAKTICARKCYSCVEKADTTIVLIVLYARLQFEDMFDTAIYDKNGMRIVELNDKAGEHERQEYIACEEVLKVSGFEAYRVEANEDGKEVKLVGYDELMSKLSVMMTYMYH